MFADVLARDAVLNTAEGAIFGGKFRLGALVARGGMGSVWRATDLALGREVAIKFMDPTLAGSAELRARFEREARAAAALSSPHVVQIHDHGVSDGTPFIVMEMLDGEDLGTRLKRVKRLGLAETASLVAQIAKGLRKAHEAGIVHRDLKPANIFLARADDDEEIAKILDFGVAKTREGGGEGTQSGVLLGSLNYMSPEQARGIRVVDGRSDLWALAAIVFRAITGQMAIAGQATGDVIIRICSLPIPRATSIAPDLPPEVDAFFDRAMARDPDHRFQTARELADAFADLAGVPSVTATRFGSLAPRPAIASTSGAASEGGQSATTTERIDEPTEPDTTVRTDPSTVQAHVKPTPGPPRGFGLKSAIVTGAALAVLATVGVWAAWAKRAPIPAASAPGLATGEPIPSAPSLATGEPIPSAPSLATGEPIPSASSLATGEPIPSASSLATGEADRASPPAASGSVGAVASASAATPSTRAPRPHAPTPSARTEKRVPMY